jgi:hypothetical protein
MISRIAPTTRRPLECNSARYKDVDLTSPHQEGQWALLEFGWMSISTMGSTALAKCLLRAETDIATNTPSNLSSR